VAGGGVIVIVNEILPLGVRRTTTVVGGQEGVAMEDQEGAAPEEVAGEGGQEEADTSAGSGQSSTIDSAMSQIPGLAESLQSQTAARQAGGAGQGGGLDELPEGDEQMDDSVDEALEEMPELRDQLGE
jgi:hypothetical protein